MHHVYARGNNRERIYFGPADRRRYLAGLARVVARCRWQCLAYCLMGTHMHLLIELAEPNLADGMHRLHGAYARDFNRRHGRRGHVFEDRYGSVRIRDDEQLVTIVRYIAQNPVAAGLCGRPEEWAWSSHAGMLDGTSPKWLDRERLLARFAAWGGDGLDRYAAAVATLE